MAQSTTISGMVTDKQSDEPIPFAAVTFRKDGRALLPILLESSPYTLLGYMRMIHSR